MENQTENQKPVTNEVNLCELFGTVRIMKRFGTACLLNSKQLLADAELLFVSGSYGHAFALAAIACEEANKPLLFPLSKLTKELDIPDAGETATRKINPARAMYDHTAKLSVTPFNLLVAYFHNAGITDKETIQAITKPVLQYKATLRNRLFDKRNKGLYVDIEDGRVISPKDISEADAKWVISEARIAVKRLEDMKFLHEVKRSRKQRRSVVRLV